MILDVEKAYYIGDYKIHISFNNGEDCIVDLEEKLRTERRKIFEPLRNMEYFKTFSVALNSVTWSNQADFAPESLLELGQKQKK